MTLLWTGLILQLLTVSHTTADFSLIKRNEIYLHQTKATFIEKENPYLKDFYYAPDFWRTSTGEMFFFRSHFGYFFTPDGEISSMIQRMPINEASPGQLPHSIAGFFKNTNDEIGSFDLSWRVNLWDKNGTFVKSILVPFFMLSSNHSVIYDNEILAIAGLKGSTKDSLFPVVLLTDSIASKSDLIYLDTNVYLDAVKKNAEIMAHVFLTPFKSGWIACNITNSPNVNLLGKNGKVLSADIVPPHYRSLNEADSFDFERFFTKEIGFNEIGQEWFSSWSCSNPILEYSSSRFLVARILYPDVYIDIYSYTDDRIDYLGYIKTDKPLLYADSSGIYLLEDNNDTCFIVGRYDILTNEERELWAGKQLVKQVDIKDIPGIKKVKPKDCGDCDRKKRKPREYVSSLDNIRLTAADGSDYLLSDSLEYGKNHVIFFAPTQECGMSKGLEMAKTYLRDTISYDMSVVVTHPYESELECFATAAHNNWDVPVFTNTDRTLLRPLLKTIPGILMVSEDGKIVSSACYPEFVLKPR